MTIKKKIVGLALAVALLGSIAATVGFVGHTAASAASAPPAVNARQALVMDYHTGQIVYEQNAKAHQPIASMVKIMTLLRCFEEMESGRFDVETEITVSQNAASMGGSQAFLDAGSVYKAGELLKSIIVASANDSCVAMAEYLSGSVDSFVDSMNTRAQALGLSDSNFINCTGLPAPGQYCCAHDAAVMMRSLIKHPLFFEYAGVWMFDFVHPGGRVTGLTNTNRMFRSYPGGDGGMTGFTTVGVSCLWARATRGHTRLISVVVGAPDSKTRNAEMTKLFDWGFANYQTKKIVDCTQPIADIAVNNGKSATVSVRAKEDFYHFTENAASAELQIDYVYDTVTAPVHIDGVVGKILIRNGEETIGEVDIVATADVEKVGYLDVVDDFIHKW